MDLRKRLGEALDRAAAGERIVIERDRRPLAVLVPMADAERMAETNVERVRRQLAALARLEAQGKRLHRQHPDWANLSAEAAVRADRDRDDPPDD